MFETGFGYLDIFSDYNLPMNKFSFEIINLKMKEFRRTPVTWKDNL